MKKLSLIILFLIFSLTSCKGVEIENKKIARAKELTKGEVMVFVAEEKNKYESRFGKDVWILRSGDGSLLFKNYVVDTVKSFVEKMMKLKIVADELNIVIGNSDIDKLTKAANEYYDKLSNDDLKFMNLEFTDVANAFIDYHISRLTIDNLSKNAERELSISEAKVIRVQYMVLDTKEDAEDLQEKLKVKGASFSYYAKSRSVDTNIEMIVKRGDEMSTRFPEVFYLSNGMVSETLTDQNKYYIFKCIDDYMENETEDRRIEILKTMKTEEFEKNFAKYEEELPIKSNSSYWRDIDLAQGKNCTVNNFEEIYYKYFPKEIV